MADFGAEKDWVQEAEVWSLKKVELLMLRVCLCWAVEPHCWKVGWLESLENLSCLHLVEAVETRIVWKCSYLKHLDERLLISLQITLNKWFQVVN